MGWDRHLYQQRPYKDTTMIWFAGILTTIGLFFLLLGVSALLRRKRLLEKFFSPKRDSILQKERKKLEKLLTSSGVSIQEYVFVQILSIVVALSLLILPPIFHIGPLAYLPLSIVAALLIYFVPKLFLIEQKRKRKEHIDRDLPIFLDLMVIILQSGGGLMNAIEIVLKEAEGVICEELLQETRRFQSDITTLPPQIAYENLVERTGSENIATIVSFIRISQESGIGLQTIFQNQSETIKERRFFEIEKRAATINIKMILVVFLFLLPAIGAFILLPMMDNALMPETTKLLNPMH